MFPAASDEQDQSGSVTSLEGEKTPLHRKKSLHALQKVFVECKKMKATVLIGLHIHLVLLKYFNKRLN